MKSIQEIQNNSRLTLDFIGEDGGRGWILLPLYKRPMVVVFSNGGGWDHVSVSYSNRCPTWDEMCQVKDIFFDESECVIQYHPAKQDYVNNHRFCLHIWKPQKCDIPTPPAIFVGIKGVSLV